MPDPVDVGLFGADGVVFEPDRVAHPIEQLSWSRFHRCFPPIRLVFLRFLLYNAFR